MIMKGVLMYNLVKNVKGILFLNEYVYIVFLGWNLNFDFLLKNNGGIDFNKVMNYIVVMYIRVWFFLKRIIYLFDLIMWKYWLIVIIFMVLREVILKMNILKVKNL